MSRLELFPQITHHLDMSQVRCGVFQGMSKYPANRHLACAEHTFGLKVSERESFQFTSDIVEIVIETLLQHVGRESLRAEFSLAVAMDVLSPNYLTEQKAL